jgi:hypothetical protein
VSWLGDVACVRVRARRRAGRGRRDAIERRSGAMLGMTRRKEAETQALA